jgi:MoxR-like ATPase
VLDPAALPELRDAARTATVSDEVEAYVVRLVRATREHPDLQLGASPRASVALYRAAQAAAFLAGRDFVLPDDVAALVGPVLTHRLVVDVDRELRGATAGETLAGIVGQVPVGVGAGTG